MKEWQKDLVFCILDKNLKDKNGSGPNQQSNTRMCTQL